MFKNQKTENMLNVHQQANMQIKYLYMQQHAEYQKQYVKWKRPGKKKTTYSMISFIWNPNIGKNYLNATKIKILQPTGGQNSPRGGTEHSGL